jgi:hypothetical protein
LSTFVVVITPGLLVHLVEKATVCGHRTCAHVAARAVNGQADELPDPVLYAVARHLIAALADTGRMDPFVEIAWRDALAVVRTALRLDELAS